MQDRPDRRPPGASPPTPAGNCCPGTTIGTDSSMPVCARSERTSRRGRSLALLALLVLLASAGARADITLRSARVVQEQGRYLLDARLDIELGRDVREALDSGVPLTFHTTVRLQRSRRWAWSVTVTRTSLRRVIQYHALTRQYLVAGLPGEDTDGFPTLEAALNRLGRIDHLPIIEQKLLRPGEDYYLEVRTRLDIEALPAPMRLVAWLSPQWWLDCGWQRAELQP
ncbi:MAG: DUF4390 domain-containing protein [Gammaproteobacteria bacterium]|nr:MAG: DUF4390 domain-containing protein [Gammaproteobacteria bacterium]